MADSVKRCVSCGVDIEWRTWGVIYCHLCSGWAQRFRAHACSAVALAVKEGRLRTAYGQPCADCGKPAKQYDHRHLSRPLEVVAVCVGCNGRRGPPLDIAELIRARRAGLSVNEARKLVNANLNAALAPLDI